MKRSWFNVQNSGGGSARISIFGEIGMFGVTFADFKRSVDAAGRARTLKVSINSPGGDVYTGFAIFDYFMRLQARKVITVEGLAASMASVIFMAGDERIMPKNATLMIHNPMGSISGDGEEIVQFGQSVKNLRLKIANAYVDRSLAPMKDVLRMMDAQTWIDAETAVDLGFATKIEEPAKIAAYFDLSNYRNAPKSYGHKKGKSVMGKSAQDLEFEDTADRDAIRKEERDALMARHKEVTALCKIAGKPTLAAGFIEADKTPAEVTAELSKLADEDAKTRLKNGKGKGTSTEVSARHAVGDGSESAVPEIDSEKIYANWNKKKALGI